LSELARVLRSGGFLILAEPAYGWLAGDNDALDHAARRFTRAELSALLTREGFQVTRSGYFNTLLFPIVAAVRLQQRLAGLFRRGRKPAAEFGPLPGPLNAILKRIFLLEKRRVLKGGFPFGVSVLCVARKRG
jgi:hypothetical protein